MSRYRITLLPLLCSMLLFGAYPKASTSIDMQIVKGLYFEDIKAYEPAREIFAKLYDRTGEGAFLIKEAKDALFAQSHYPETIRRLLHLRKQTPYDKEITRILIPLYMESNNYEAAKKEAERLLEDSHDPRDIDLASNPFLYGGDLKRATQILRKLYEHTQRVSDLLRLSDLLVYRGKSDEAIRLLETHRRLKGEDKAIYAALLKLYSAKKDIDGLLEAYKGLYKLKPAREVLDRILEIYAYKHDLNSAVAFLESVDAPKEVLYDIYKMTKHYNKAMVLAQDMARRSDDPRWLAELGVLTYETAKNKDDKEMLKKMSEWFEKALAKGVDDSLYLNYYGYTLIDKNLDVAKGVALIRKALTQQPDNSYYLDSLAWGYYKLRECDKAFKTMKRVVEKEGTGVPEIAQHWRAIKECK